MQKTKAWTKTREKYIPVKRRQNLAETDRGSYYKVERLEEFLDSKGAFCIVNKSDNDDESYNGNKWQQQLPEGFANSCYKIVTPILLQKLINDFALCKHRSRSSHQRCSVKKYVLRDFTKLTGKHLCQSLFFNEVAGLPATAFA